MIINKKRKPLNFEESPTKSYKTVETAGVGNGISCPKSLQFFSVPDQGQWYRVPDSLLLSDNALISRAINNLTHCIKTTLNNQEQTQAITSLTQVLKAIVAHFPQSTSDNYRALTRQLLL